MASITLAQIRTQCRERADIENDPHITDTELNTMINASIKELHDILVNQYEDYYIKDVSFSTVSGTNEYSLTTVITDADFYKLKGVDVTDAGRTFPVRRYNWNERHRKDNVYTHNSDVEYRLMGDNIRLIPTPTSTSTITVWYIPKATELSLDADTYDDINGFIEYVVVDVGIKVKVKSEEDTREMERQKQLLFQRITASTQDRDAEEPMGISDIERTGYYEYY